MAKREETCLESSALSVDGRSWLRVMVWIPEAGCTRRGAVQLVHGMLEHIGRYDDFARFLAGLGYVVFGHDHIGHGKSVTSADELGHMPLHGGRDILVGDVLKVRKEAFALVPGTDELPLILFGHSMGSFVVRNVIARDAEGLAGAILCGTGDQPRALSVAGHALCQILGALRGAEYRSKLIDSMAVGQFASAIEDARTEKDWLSSDPKVVDAMLADPLSGTMFTIGGYATLTDLTAYAVSREAAAAVPHDLPLLFVAGAEDPVGNNGAGPKRAAQRYRDAGVIDVSVIIYPEMRHEILNEIRHEDAYTDIEQWISDRAIRAVLAREGSAAAAEGTESGEADGGEAAAAPAATDAADQGGAAIDAPAATDAATDTAEERGEGR